MGGRGSSGGNNPGGSKATASMNAKASPSVTNKVQERQARQILSITDSGIDKAVFKQDKFANRYVASTGTVAYPDGEKSNKAVEMVIMPQRNNGKTFYTTRFIVKHVGSDWQYVDRQYSSLNAAKAGVKDDVKEYLSDLQRERRR